MAIANRALLLHMTEIIESTDITNALGETTSLILTIEVGIMPFDKRVKNVIFVINGFSLTRHDTYEEAIRVYNKIVDHYNQFKK